MHINLLMLVIEKIELGSKLVYKLFTVIATVILLASCIPKGELASLLEGQWEGSDGVLKWCVGYTSEPYYETGSNTVYIYREIDNQHNGLGYQYQYKEGYWQANRGMRLFQNTALTHNAKGQPIPVEDQRGSKSRNLVHDINAKEYSFIAEEAEDDAVLKINYRVDNCDSYRENYQQYITKLQSENATSESVLSKEPAHLIKEKKE